MKTKRKKLIGAVCAIVLIAAFALFAKAWSSPKACMIRALKATLSSSYAKELINIAGLLEEGAFQSSSELTVSRAVSERYKEFSYAEGLSLKTDLQMDSSSKALSASTKVSYLMKPYFDLNIYGEPSVISIQLPALFDSYFSADPSRIGQDFNASLFAKLTGFTLDPDFAVTLFPDIAPSSPVTLNEEWLKNLEVAVSDTTADTQDVFFGDFDTRYEVTAPEGSFRLYEKDGLIHGLFYKTASGVSCCLVLNEQTLSFQAESALDSLEISGTLDTNEADAPVIQLAALKFKKGQESVTLYGNVSFAPLTQPIEIPYDDAKSLWDMKLTDLPLNLSWLY